jgi:hypothetical protein
VPLRSKLGIAGGAFIVLTALAVPAEERRGLPTIFILTLAVIVAVYVVVDVLWASSRRRALAAEARRLGLAFSAKDPFDVLGMPFALIRRSRHTFREAENVLWGRWRDLEVRVFDYAYQESEDEWRRFTGTMTAVPEGWPALVIEPGHLAASSSLTGLRSIEFESERFNRTFRVRCADRRFANALIDARMMEWLLGLSDGWGFEIAGPWILGYRDQPKPREVESVLVTLASFVERIPSVVHSLYPPERAAIAPRPDVLPPPERSDR